MHLRDLIHPKDITVSEQTTAAPADPIGSEDKDAQIAALQAQIAALEATPDSTPEPAAAPVDYGTLPADVTVGSVVAFHDDPDTPIPTYGVVVAIETVDDATGGDPVEGQPSHTQLAVSPLPPARPLTPLDLIAGG